MREFFLTLFDMSITAGWLVPVVLVLRFIMKKTPKALICVLWALVAVRLLLPVSIESEISLVPNSAEITERIITAVSAPSNTDGSVTDTPTDIVVPDVGEGKPSEDSAPDWLNAVPYIWLFGAAAMLTYSAVNFLRIHRKVKASVKLYDNIRLCDNISSPFVVGFLRPKVYLPSDMGTAEQRYVLAHELAHIKRGDHIWKPLGWVILSVYWFNPLFWVAFVIFCRDIELACDERAVSRMDAAEKRNYAMTLLTCSVPKRQIAAYPLSFGAVGVKQRVSSVAKYKKPTFWVVFASVVLSIVVSMFFMTDPKSSVSAAGVDDPTKDTVSNITDVSTPDKPYDDSGELQYIYYICVDGSEQSGSTVALVPSENKFTFSLSYGNGYACFGYYVESDGKVIATAQEGNRLVFVRNGNSLVFAANESDPIPSFYDGDNTVLPNSTAFVLN